MKKLIIVESPAKAKTISKIVGSDFIVKASVGHVRDLPDHALGIKITNGDKHFEPTYTITKGKKAVVADLAKKAKECDEIYLASDPDREGEAIAWHLKKILEDTFKKGETKTFKRVQYNEITPSAVRRAIENPREIDQHRVDAQQARRILDRLVGYKVSPSLWKQVGKGLSAGRVQSVGLRLICERESEINAFIPEPYWLFAAKVHKRNEPKTAFTVKLRQIDGAKAVINTEEMAAKVDAALRCSKFSVGDLTVQRRSRKPYAPFITSTLQQAASTSLGYSPNTTMSLAQKLYEGIDLAGEGPTGLITYMRTDSFTVAKEAKQACRTFIKQTCGDEYVSKKPRVYKNKSGAQAAHEAIRPTDPALTPEKLAGKLKPQELKLYDLIWRRFVASEMADAVSKVTTAKITAAPENGFDSLMLSASASQLIFAGFTKILDMPLKTQRTNEKEGEDDQLDSLPPLTIGEPLEGVDVSGERKETSPPPRYNEASLVKALEANGIGRPSTYAAIIATLLNRTYVLKEKRNLIPTELGTKVNTFLVSHYAELFDIGFTARMEKQLDEVENPKASLDWQGMLAEFYAHLKKWLLAAKPPAADRNVVSAVLEKFKEVNEWAPPVKSGKRTFSDEKFVTEISDLFHGKKPQRTSKTKKSTSPDTKKTTRTADADGTAPKQGDVSQNQLRALLAIMTLYRKQVSDLEGFLKSIGQADILKDEKLQPPRESTLAVFESIDRVGIDEGSETFYTSLRNQVRRGKRLSPKQRHYLDKMFINMQEKIENFSKEMCERLEVVYAEPEPRNEEKIQDVIAGLANVTEWKKPVKKGRRIYDDADFFESVTTQYAVKKRLSKAQLKVLERMFLRYREQIPGADTIIEKHAIKLPAKTTRKQSENSPVNSHATIP